MTTALQPATYDTYEVVPGWARETLEAHADDPRPVLHRVSDAVLVSTTWEVLVRGGTGDAVWNAAQWEMIATGHMHNHMRM